MYAFGGTGKLTNTAGLSGHKSLHYKMGIKLLLYSHHAYVINREGLAIGKLFLVQTCASSGSYHYNYNCTQSLLPLPGILHEKQVQVR